MDNLHSCEVEFGGFFLCVGGGGWRDCIYSSHDIKINVAWNIIFIIYTDEKTSFLQSLTGSFVRQIYFHIKVIYEKKIQPSYC